MGAETPKVVMNYSSLEHHHCLMILKIQLIGSKKEEKKKKKRKTRKKSVSLCFSLSLSFSISFLDPIRYFFEKT